jgi:glucose-6-phosphate isomerase
LYVEELVAPRTVNTMPEATLQAFLDHGKVNPRAVLDRLDEAEEVLSQAEQAGVDLHQIGVELLEEGIEAFNADFEKLLATVGEALKQETKATCTTPGRIVADGAFSNELAMRLAEIERASVVPRTWRGDYRVWKDDPTEITQPNRLGWLTVFERMQDEASSLRAFAAEVKQEGYETAVLLGMGGSSLAPEVMATTFTTEGLALKVLDTTVPEDIIAVEKSINLSKTLFIVSSKSGTTLETVSQLGYFWDKLSDGRHFIAITDPGTPLTSLARQRGFRRLFLNPESIGGRYSALSYFGLVPAALIGLDPAQLLDGGLDMQQACHYCQPPAANPAVWLGAILGTAALAGRDKLTLVLPEEIVALGDWIEQLIAESTGKEGKGIVPIIGEPLGGPEAYGVDRIFVTYGDAPGLTAVEAAGQPAVHLPYEGPQQLGAEFFRWQFATAVAGSILAINPFDQPDVQLAKDAASRFLEMGPQDFQTRSVVELLQLARPGDYFALLAYLPRRDDVRERIAALRLKLRDRYGMATTVGFGPRYLHSTGQIHKGGPNSGVFFQLLDADEVDVAIPGKPFSFGQLKRAQADGDMEALLSHGRRAARMTLDQLEEALR